MYCYGLEDKRAIDKTLDLYDNKRNAKYVLDVITNKDVTYEKGDGSLVDPIIISE